MIEFIIPSGFLYFYLHDNQTKARRRLGVGMSASCLSSEFPLSVPMPAVPLPLGGTAFLSPPDILGLLGVQCMGRATTSVEPPPPQGGAVGASTAETQPRLALQVRKQESRVTIPLLEITFCVCIIEMNS